MTLSDVPPERVILVLGAPRSGTTWLAKIFDSHPDVLYRHEPDTVFRDGRLQAFFDVGEIPRFKAEASVYLRKLIATNTLKTAGSLPIFAKSYYSPPVQAFRRALVYFLRLAEMAGHAGPRGVKRLRLPDLLPPGATADLRICIKSVSSRGRARLFAEALPGCRVIYIVRDPCGQVASMIRGAALGKFEEEIYPEELLHTEQAARYGLTRERLAGLPRVEQLAWAWAILNEKAIDDLAGLSTARILRYQDLCLHPEQEARSLFAFCGLSWNSQTEAFLVASTRSNAPDRYYQVFKNTEAAMNRWRRELSPDDQQRIIGVVRATRMRALCPEYEI